MALKDVLTALKTLLEKTKLPSCEGGHAELADESDPEGTVLIKDKDGRVVVWMSREDFESFREEHSDGQT